MDNEQSEDRRGWLRLGIPAIAGAVVLAVFLPWVLLTSKQERDIRQAINTYEPFAIPELPLRFSRTIPFDSLGFTGKGLSAGLWTWSEKGLQLADAGRKYFAEDDREIWAITGAGKREVAAVEGYRDDGNRRHVDFTYRWTELTPPGQRLVPYGPQLGKEYDGNAWLVKTGGEWKVEKLATPDWDKMIAVLQDNAAGVRK